MDSATIINTFTDFLIYYQSLKRINNRIDNSHLKSLKKVGNLESNFEGEIEFKNVNARYDKNLPQVLFNINFKI